MNSRERIISSRGAKIGLSTKDTSMTRYMGMVCKGRKLRPESWRTVASSPMARSAYPPATAAAAARSDTSSFS